MRTCYYCNSALTNRNRTAEHVIPNALGGRLVSYKLLCRNCNIKLGETVDAELTESFKELMSEKNIVRDRKQRVEGRRKQNGNNIPTSKADGQEDISRENKTDKEDIALRGIAKIAIGMYLHRGGELRHVQKAIRMLKGEVSTNGIVRAVPIAKMPYYGDYDLKHTIYVGGSPIERKLQIYLTLFDEKAYVVDLSDEYDGTPVGYSYEMEILTQPE